MQKINLLCLTISLISLSISAAEDAISKHSRGLVKVIEYLTVVQGTNSEPTYRRGLEKPTQTWDYQFGFTSADIANGIHRDVAGSIDTINLEEALILHSGFTDIHETAHLLINFFNLVQDAPARALISYFPNAVIKNARNQVTLRTLLHAAALNENLTRITIQLLLETGIDPEIRDGGGRRASDLTQNPKIRALLGGRN